MLPRFLLALIFLAASQTPAYAVVHIIAQCGETCDNGETCKLNDNFTCATNPAVTLAGGSNLDFQGHTFTCSGCGGFQSTGVQVTAAGSTVQDTVGGGGVRGYSIGVACNYNNSSLVKNVHIDGGSQSVSSGIDGCRKIQGAVITNMTYVGIWNSALGDTDYIKDSYIIGKSTGGAQGASTGIWLEGNGSALIDHNVIVNTYDQGIMSVYTASSLDITNNMLFNQLDYGQIWIFTGNTPPTLSGNVCGDPNESACATCIATGGCKEPGIPVEVP